MKPIRLDTDGCGFHEVEGQEIRIGFQVSGFGALFRGVRSENWDTGYLGSSLSISGDRILLRSTIK
jgi:hypothetical protein